MCQAKPGPRCSADVKSAIVSNQIKIKEQQSNLDGLQEDYEYELKGSGSPQEKENLAQAKKVVEELKSLEQDKLQLQHMFYATPEGRKELEGRIKELQDLPKYHVHYKGSAVRLSNMLATQTEADGYVKWQKDAVKNLKKIEKRQGTEAAHAIAKQQLVSTQMMSNAMAQEEASVQQKFDSTFDYEDDNAGFVERQSLGKVLKVMRINRIYSQLRIKDLESYMNTRSKKRLADVA